MIFGRDLFFSFVFLRPFPIAIVNRAFHKKKHVKFLAPGVTRVAVDAGENGNGGSKLGKNRDFSFSLRKSGSLIPVPRRTGYYIYISGCSGARGGGTPRNTLSQLLSRWFIAHLKRWKRKERRRTWERRKKLKMMNAAVAEEVKLAVVKWRLTSFKWLWLSDKKVKKNSRPGK